MEGQKDEAKARFSSKFSDNFSTAQTNYAIIKKNDEADNLSVS